VDEPLEAHERLVGTGLRDPAGVAVRVPALSVS
jgi:hypothetical protein